MKHFKSYKFRIYPTTNQKLSFSRYFGASRFIYNYYLNKNKNNYLNNIKHLTKYDMFMDVVKLKKQSGFEWLDDIDSICLRNAICYLDTAFKMFFSKINKYPNFKNKKSNYQTYKTNQNIITNTNIKLPKIGTIEGKFHQVVNFDLVKETTIIKTASGKYYVSLLVEENITPLPKTGMLIGGDLGLKKILTLSNGHEFEHPEKILKKANLKLKQEQKKLSRMKKGSSNYNKQRVKVARAYEKIVNIRNNYYHKISKYLVENYDVICLESLNVAGMLKNKKLSMKLHESAFGDLVKFISYKAKFYGKDVVQISQWFPSSKKCNDCGFINNHLSLDMREWICPNCGIVHDRDINAAKNILTEGLKQKSEAETVLVEKKKSSPKPMKKQANKNESSEEIQLVCGCGKSLS